MGADRKPLIKRADQSSTMEQEGSHPERISSYQAERALKARYIRARRYHANAVTELDHVWKSAMTRARNAPNGGFTPLAWRTVEREMAPLFAGVPGEPAE
jgi:hypothetical protein